MKQHKNRRDFIAWVRLRADEAKMLQIMAERERRDQSKMIRQCIAEAAERRGLVIEETHPIPEVA